MTLEGIICMEPCLVKAFLNAFALLGQIFNRVTLHQKPYFCVIEPEKSSQGQVIWMFLFTAIMTEGIK